MASTLVLPLFLSWSFLVTPIPHDPLFLLVSFIFWRLNLENTFSVWIYITHSKIRNKLIKNNIESDMLNWLQCFSINIIQKLKWERILFLPYLTYSMLLGFWISEQGWNSGSTLEMQLDRSRIELEPLIMPRRKEKESEDNNNQLTNQTTIGSESQKEWMKKCNLKASSVGLKVMSPLTTCSPGRNLGAIAPGSVLLLVIKKKNGSKLNPNHTFANQRQERNKTSFLRQAISRCWEPPAHLVDASAKLGL